MIPRKATTVLGYYLRCGFYRWKCYRAEIKALRRLFAEIVHFNTDERSFACGFIQSALRARARGVIVMERKLDGHLYAESQPYYWDLLPDVQQRLHDLRQHPEDGDEISYFVRHCNLERFDQYYLSESNAYELMGGLGFISEPSIDAMQQFFSKRRDFQFSDDGKLIQASIVDDRGRPYQGCYIPGLKLAIEYGSSAAV